MQETMFCSTCKLLPPSYALLEYGSLHGLLVEKYLSVAEAFHYSHWVEYPLTAASSNRGLGNLVEKELVVGLVSMNLSCYLQTLSVRQWGPSFLVNCNLDCLK